MPLGSIDRHDFAVSQSLDVAHRGLAEETAVLTVELAHALVADFIRRAVASIPSISIRCLAVCSRSCFWYCSGLIAVNARN